MKCKWLQLFTRVLLLASVLAVASSFAQSSTNTGESPEKKGSGIVATINGQAITELELNHAAGGPANGVADPQARALIFSQVLDELINQILLEQEFKKNSQRKDQNNAWQVDFANRQTAASFYLNSQLNKLPKLDERIVNDFIIQHPEFTAKRKTYHFNQIVVDASIKSTLPDLKALIAKGDNLEGIRDWLKQNRVPNLRTNLWRGSEQIAPGVLKTLEKINKNVIDIQMTADNEKIIIIKLIDSYPDPVDIEDARAGFIRGYQEDIRSRAAQTIMKDLRKSAAIQIVRSDFAAPSEKKDLSIGRVVPQGSIFNYISIIWYFVLLVLVPLSMTMTYQGLKSSHIEEQKRISKLDYSHPSLIKPYFWIAPVFLLLTVWFVFPLYVTLESPPFWLTFQILLKLFVSGLFIGGIIALVCSFVPWLRRRLRKSSLGLIILLSIHSLMMFGIFFG